MKNNIKTKLIEAANKQPIDDFSAEIISRVDTNKVLNATPTPVRKKRFNFAPVVMFGAAACTLALVVGVSIGLNLNNGNKVNNGNEPADTIHTYSDEVGTVLNKISTQESYNIINVANTLNVVPVNDIAIGAGMDDDIEAILVDDFNPYVYDIEAMYNLDDPVVATVSKNNNTAYQFDKDLKVVSPYYEYHLYYNEVITEQKNIGEANYQEKSTLNGVIVCGAYSYIFETKKTIKDSANNAIVDYESTVNVSETRYVEVKSHFKYELTTKKSNYTYTYNYYDGANTKQVYIDQKINDEGNTTEVQFKARKNAENKYDFDLVVTPNTDNDLNCKIKSRSTDPFVVSKQADNSHNFVFTSGHIYNR